MKLKYNIRMNFENNLFSNSFYQVVKKGIIFSKTFVRFFFFLSFIVYRIKGSYYHITLSGCMAPRRERNEVIYAFPDLVRFRRPSGRFPSDRNPSFGLFTSRSCLCRLFSHNQEFFPILPESKAGLVSS